MDLLLTIQIFIFMTFDVDRIISFMEKFMNVTKGDIGEQESAEPSTPSTSTGGGTTSSSSPTIKKWESGRTFGKTYMNDPKYKWESGRTLGKTYMNDPKYKWETGLTRGHGNPVP
jgi:hypothetical protein